MRIEEENLLPLSLLCKVSERKDKRADERSKHNRRTQKNEPHDPASGCTRRMPPVVAAESTCLLRDAPKTCGTEEGRGKKGKCQFMQMASMRIMSVAVATLLLLLATSTRIHAEVDADAERLAGEAAAKAARAAADADPDVQDMKELLNEINSDVAEAAKKKLNPEEYEMYKVRFPR